MREPLLTHIIDPRVAESHTQTRSNPVKFVRKLTDEEITVVSNSADITQVCAAQNSKSLNKIELLKDTASLGVEIFRLASNLILVAMVIGNSLELRLLGAERAQEKMMIQFQCRVPSLTEEVLLPYVARSLYIKALGIQPRVMPEDGHIRLTTDDDISWLCWKTGFCCSSLVDDEDTRGFYKGLLYLRAFVLFLLYYWEKHSIKQLINHQNQKTRVN
ncbi:hypothetical protein Tco_1250327, partial [Tanacetum coccineum]